MKSQIIQTERIQRLNSRETAAGDYVLYWMQQSQRAEFNHALEYAVERANELNQPVLVMFGLMDDYPEANLRHYTFMLEGLREVQQSLAGRGIKMVVQRGRPSRVALAAGKRASLIVCDRGYLRHQKAWRNELAKDAGCRVVQVETDVVVPVEVTSGKAEYAARTIRPKIHNNLDRWLAALKTAPVRKDSLNLKVDGVALDGPEELLRGLRIDSGVAPVSPLFRGGTSAAREHFGNFLDRRLSHYSENRNQPQTDDVSCMAMYLHFGQISPLYLALQIMENESAPQENRDDFLEELIVRRELACNFVHYTGDYDSFSSLPQWARTTLAEHAGDEREPLYSPEQLEQAETHDAYWNAAMNEMRFSGYMHNYMRMYWGKKILEWSASPEQAYDTTLALNNKYFLDGRDPNSYANVAWIFGLHDRPWKERPIFGKVRYMSASGLERKCDIGAYVRKVEALVRELGD